MKKVLYIFGGLIAFVLLAMVLIPVLFKDKIKAKIDEEIAKSVNAKVYMDDFSLSLFKNFPNFTLTLDKFGVANNAPFEGDTLIDVKQFAVVLDVFSVISGKSIKINKISLIEPNIKVLVKKDGTANYDIAKPSTDTTQTIETEEKPSNFSININKWEIVNGNILYNDQKSNLYTLIKQLNHQGKGDFSTDIVDLGTHTEIAELTLSKDTVRYFKKNKITTDLIVNINKPLSKYTFKDNTLIINELALGLDGWLQQKPDSSMDMDLSFKVKETAFKSILSLVPGMYTESFKDIKADGSLALSAYAKGTYKNEKLPLFGLELLIKDGMFQYEKLPTSVKNIQVDLKVDNSDGVIDNTLINLKNLHLEIGSNPIDAKMIVKGIKSYDIDGNLKAKLNLAELTSIFPIDSLTLKGLFGLDVTAKGKYVSAAQLPAINAKMSMNDGFVKSEKMPKAPLEKINFSAMVQNGTGRMEDMLFVLENLSMVLAGEPILASAKVSNFKDYTYSAAFKGLIDFDNLLKIFPLDSMEIHGKMKADIATSGQMSLISAGKYDQLPTSGTLGFQNFSFKSFSFPQGIKLTQANMSFDPKLITVSQMDGFVGKSDFSATGTFSNYMAYVFQNQTLVGKLDFKSKSFDVNEWMSSDSDTKETKKEEPVKKEDEKAAEIPKNIDFTMNSSLGTVLYDNLTMTNMEGLITIKDGIFKLSKGNFDMLGGHFITNCLYSSQDLSKPKFNFDLDIKNLEIPKAFEAFTSVQKFAPAAKNMEGKFNTFFAIDSDLGQDMKPKYETMSGKGLLDLLDSKLKDAGFFTKVNSLAKTSLGNSNNTNEIKIGNAKIVFEIKDGKVNFQPFDVNAGDVKSKIGGSYGLDNTVNYIINSEVPAKGVGAAASGLLSQFGGGALNVDKFNVSLGVTGPASSPQVKVISVTPMGAGGTTVKGNITNQINNLKDQATQKAQQEAQKLQQEAQQRAQQEAQRAQQEAQQKAQQAQQEVQKRAAEEAQKLKDKVKLPW